MMKKIYLLLMGLALLSCKGDSALPSGLGSDGGPQTGRGGSMARFTIIGDHLYTVNGNNLKTFSLERNELRLVSSLEINAFAETIFPFKNHLLLGTRTGMMIYGLIDEARPHFVSQYSHIASCDPVVAQGNYAYVTLRNGTPCMRGSNQMDVLNISNLQSPFLVSSYQMRNPQGLSADGEKLYVCEGDAGVSIFDLKEPSNPSFVVQKTEIRAFDVIAFDSHLIFTGSDGISQYQSLGDQLIPLSTISSGE